ncbi:hypothetical protein Y1Q_0008278 [Alligator mississippiensis]|uniref:Uncharacterized protein n=1 Tax=Alligator mississippiensis TaxID=8496 RepID=A0A151N1X1_ALLMI|nr:hypothetical protein Y1Q_0008278 [Alligator mississippiensis]
MHEPNQDSRSKLQSSDDGGKDKGERALLSTAVQKSWRAGPRVDLPLKVMELVHEANPTYSKATEDHNII